MKTSHSIVTAIVFFCLANSLIAAPPKTISYQGYMKDATGRPETAPTDLTFRLYSTASGVGSVWSETLRVSPANGVYSVELGKVAPFGTLLFDRQYFLGIQVEADPEMRPLQMLLAVPYALHAGCYPGDMLNCYTGPPETLNQGLCKSGVRTCAPDGSSFGTCVGELTPNCNGACRDFSGDVANCGNCGTICVAPVHATATCSGGACGFVCTSSYANCDGTAANGCETSLQTSVLNCGSCGTICAAPVHAMPTCSGGVCGFVCTSGYGNCNLNAGDGCEVNVQTNVLNCGSCGTTCERANAVATCSAGVCGFTCNSGYADCNKTAADGCEADLSFDTSNCGMCGATCVFGYACLLGKCTRVLP